MIRCKIRKHTKAVAVLILCVAVCTFLWQHLAEKGKFRFLGHGVLKER